MVAGTGRRLELHGNLAYYPQHGYTQTHQAQQDGFHRVFFRKPVDT